MAVTTQNSTEWDAIYGGDPSVLRADQWYGKLRILAYNFTQSGAGDANSLARLFKLPTRCSLIGPLCRAEWSAMGAGRTMDIGPVAYTEPDGDAVIADEDGLIAAEDVSSAGNSVYDGALIVGGIWAPNSRDSITVQAKIEAAAVGDGETIKGYAIIVVE